MAEALVGDFPMANQSLALTSEQGGMTFSRCRLKEAVPRRRRYRDERLGTPLPTRENLTQAPALSERLPDAVADDEAGVVRLIERPGRREAARGGHGAVLARSRFLGGTWSAAKCIQRHGCGGAVASCGRGYRVLNRRNGPPPVHPPSVRGAGLLIGGRAIQRPPNNRLNALLIVELEILHSSHRKWGSGYRRRDNRPVSNVR